MRSRPTAPLSRSTWNALARCEPAAQRLRLSEAQNGPFNKPMKYRVGIDVGGTFTDFLLVRDDGSFSTYKTFTSTPDQSIGIMEGVAKFAADEGTGLGAFLGK